MYIVKLEFVDLAECCLLVGTAQSKAQALNVIFLFSTPYNMDIFKASLTFKCMTEHLFADFSYSIALDTYL